MADSIFVSVDTTGADTSAWMALEEYPYVRVHLVGAPHPHHHFAWWPWVLVAIVVVTILQRRRPSTPMSGPSAAENP